MSFSLTPVRMGLLTAIVALQACDSSNDSDPDIRAQAVDGYIVAANVTCDNEESNATAAAGRFTCPADTSLMRISGGQDVGFDETATDGGIPFTGELVAPGSFDYVTPLSTLVVAMVIEKNGEYRSSGVDEATKEMAAVFGYGDSELDLNSDPKTTLIITQLNAQVHEVLSAFVESPENYGKAVKAFAAFVGKSAESGQTFALSSQANEVLTQINAELTIAEPALAIPDGQIADIAAVVQANNARFAAATDVDELDKVAKEATVERAALTLVRDQTSVSFRSGAGVTTSTIDTFESSALNNRSYGTVISTALTGLSYDRDFIQVNRNLTNVKVSLGFQMKGVGSNQRSLSYLTHDARITARQGNPGSLQVRIPQNADLHVTSTSSTGKAVKTTIKLDGEHAFTNDDGSISVNNGRVREELESRNLDDVLNGNGNYEVTFAIGGLRVNSTKGGTASANGAHTIQANNSSLAGTGVKGYITVLDN